MTRIAYCEIDNTVDDESMIDEECNGGCGMPMLGAEREPCPTGDGCRDENHHFGLGGDHVITDER